MPVHDWTRVEAGIFHAFHVGWIPEIQRSLNGGLLPEGYYALAEQHTGCAIADILTLHTRPETSDPLLLRPSAGGTIATHAPPRVRWKQTLEGSPLARRRTVAIRHVSGHRLVAMVEILSPANKDRAERVADFAAKVVSALDAGVHVLVIDLLPPGPCDPQGIHGVIHQALEGTDTLYPLPAAEPLTLAAYAAGPKVDIYLEHRAVGAPLPEMPLFLSPDRYVYVPLEPTYQAAYQGMPGF
jgi:hypothetical protein